MCRELLLATRYPLRTWTVPPNINVGSVRVIFIFKHARCLLHKCCIDLMHLLTTAPKVQREQTSLVVSILKLVPINEVRYAS
jgi:hypothetical protein